MPKPIGNMIFNLHRDDKVSGKTKAKFGPQSLTPGGATPGQAPGLVPGSAPGSAPAPTNSAKKPTKYKTRKR